MSQRIILVRIKTSEPIESEERKKNNKTKTRINGRREIKVEVISGEHQS